MTTTRSTVLVLVAAAVAAAVGSCAPGDEAGDGEPTGGEVSSSERPAGKSRATLGGSGARTPGARPGRASAPAVTVTLITGDRVVVIGESVRVDAAPSRRGISFRVVRSGGRIRVIPFDAVALLASGALDPRLFDVTELLELEYDDGHRADMPLLVARAGAAGLRAASAALAAAGARTTRALPSIGGEAVSVPKAGASAVWSALVGADRTPRALVGPGGGPGTRVWLDGKRQVVLDRSAAQIGAPAAWDAGYTGAGVVIAVLDTGIEATHPDFEGRIDQEIDFLDGGADGAPDDVGHGTHVASILAGSGAAEGGLYRGIAPDAHLLVGKVCELDGCPESAILAGMEWAASSGAAIVNLSLGGPDTSGTDPLEQAIDELTAQYGTLFVVAAGNLGDCGGPLGDQVTSPGTADAALSVGAVERDDLLAWFSCRGPRIGDAGVKPDVTAPGVEIVAARAVGTPAGDLDPVDELYARLSGTSMATPHVAGAAALLAQQHPGWRAAELKSALMSSARPTEGMTVFEQGTGRIDLARGIAQTATASPASVAFGVVPWPHDDDEPIARTLTYENHGDQALDLTLSVEASGPDGEPAPAGMFTALPSAVSIPPGGQAEVTVTADTRVEGPDGVYAGVLVASAGEQSVRATLAVHRRAETYDTTFRVVDRQGNPTWAFVTLANLATGDFELLYIESGELTLPLARGSYLVEVFTAAVGDRDFLDEITMVQPLLEVTGPTEVLYDAGRAAPVDLGVTDPEARSWLEIIEYRRTTAAGDFGVASFVFREGADRTPRAFLAHVGPEVAPDELETFLGSWLARVPPDDPDRTFDSPVVYNLFFAPPAGRFPTGFSGRVAPEDLHAVEIEVHAGLPGGQTVTMSGAFSSPDDDVAWLSGNYHRTPGRRTHYFTPGVRWLTIVDQEDANGEVPVSHMTRPPRDDFPAREIWNGGVLGPIVSNPGFSSGPQFARSDGTLFYWADLFADGAGHSSSVRGEAQVRLFAGDELIAEVPFLIYPILGLPEEETSYRLEAESIRPPGTDRSSRVSATWTFRSSAEDEGQALPLFAVRYQPRLDGEHRAPGGGFVAVPFQINRQEGAPFAPIRAVQIEASYDGGATWHHAIVLRIGDRGVAILHHPASGSVSLRARAADTAGDAVDQTIVDAYHLR
ncbi:MAG TPA: S8 family serine peptidase [Kofleriaceae bacterium]|nr:S8 family serine peptidase [Kofleriaceae bacterium]